MKKFLSLVLALVMTMSLVTVSAGAKDYADASDIEYVEAVDVLSAIGVLEGDANGFRPNDTLKRSEAAKIIAALKLTPKTAASLTADTAPFADVAKSHWAAGYIAEGVDSGIIAGVGDNKFAPDAELTGFAYLKMLLVCLGYDAAAENMVGANWSVNVAKLAKEVKLTAGNDDFVGSAAVTREEAALYALNALKAQPVKYADKGTAITINGVEIVTGGSEPTPDTDYDAYKDVNFKKLKDYPAYDDFNRPATEWVFKGEQVGVYAEAPVLTLTAKTDADDLADALKDAGYKYVVDAEGNTVKLTDTTYEDANPTGNGWVVEFYETTGLLNEGKKDEKEVDAVELNPIVIKTIFTQVTKLGKDLKSTDDKDERDITTGAGVAEYEDELLANFEELYDELEADDWVLVRKATAGDNKDKIVSIELPEIIEGKLTKKSSSKITVDGTAYKLAAGVAASAFGVSTKDQKVWLDSYGYALKGELKGTDDSDIVYLVKLFDSEDKYGTTTYYAQVVTAKGEIVELTIDEDASLEGIVEGTLCVYSGDEDEATLYNADAEEYIKVTSDLDSLIKVGGKYYADEVTMVYVDGEGAKLKVTTADNAQKFELTKDDPETEEVETAETVYALLNDDGEVDVVFVAGEAQAEAADADELVFVASTKVAGETLDDDDKLVNTYNVYFDGKKTEVIATGIKDKDGVGFYSYAVKGSTYELEKEDSTTITSIAKDKYMTLANGETDVKLDGVIYDTTDNDITTLAELVDQWEIADESETDDVERVTAHVVYDEKDEVVTLIYIVK